MRLQMIWLPNHWRTEEEPMGGYEQSKARIAIRAEAIRMERLALGRWEWEGGTTLAGYTPSIMGRIRDVRGGHRAAPAVYATARDSGSSSGKSDLATQGALSQHD